MRLKRQHTGKQGNLKEHPFSIFWHSSVRFMQWLKDKPQIVGEVETLAHHCIIYTYISNGQKNLGTGSLPIINSLQHDNML